MLIAPCGLQQISRASTLYSDLGTSSWGTHNRIIEYGEWDGSSGRTGNFTPGYDANGSVTKKITWNTHGTTTDPSDDTKIEEVTYEYNLQNRLAKVTTYDYITPATSVVAYKYNADGVRVAKIEDPDGSAVTTIYLTDSYNHTGYAQTLEEMTFNALDPDPVNDIPASRKTYTIGDDMLTEATAEYDYDASDWTYYAAQHLMYDGHGSTRQLVTGSVPNTTIVDDFSYDGYGVLLQNETVASQRPGHVSSQATSLLYAGEHFDTDSQNYYLRARWYDSLSGRFNRMDPFAGSPQDPQSLHKYLYCHANPINAVDPSGQLIGSLADLMSNITARFMVLWMTYGGTVLNVLTKAVYITAGLYAASNISLTLIEWGYLPHDIQGYIEAVRHYSGVGFVLSLAALCFLSTLPDPRQIARPPQKVPRLLQDKAVDGNPAPEPMPTSRNVAQNPSINAEKDRDVLRFTRQKAFQVRVDQRQVKLHTEGLVQKGWNRPDNQGIFESRPSTIIEYDTRLDRLIIARDRILANDPEAMVVLKWFDQAGNYTIVP